MTGTVARFIYDLAVAAISLALIAGTLTALASHQIGNLDAVLVMKGAALAMFVAVMRLVMHSAPWPITNLAAGFRRTR